MANHSPEKMGFYKTPSQMPAETRYRCHFCEQEFHPRNAVQRFCSRACSARSRCNHFGPNITGLALEPKVCPQCGTIFQPFHPLQTGCSRQCSQAILARLRRAKLRPPEAEPAHRTCKRCQATKPVADFATLKDRPRQYHKSCRACEANMLASRPIDHDSQSRREQGRLKHLRKNYGIYPEEVDILLKQQNHQCAICGASPAKRLGVDHCHTTGAIRGLLCDPCNQGLAGFRDNPDRLQAAIAYLASYPERCREINDRIARERQGLIRRPRRELGPRKSKLCQYCNQLFTPLYPTRKYCSRACANLGRPKPPKQPKPDKIYTRQRPQKNRGCCVPGCANKHNTRGYCSMHIQRIKLGIPLTLPLMKNRQHGCRFPSCTREHYARGYCRYHYHKLRETEGKQWKEDREAETLVRDGPANL